MTVIVVGYGNGESDPFTCSAEVGDGFLDMPNSLLLECSRGQSLDPSSIDELLLILENKVAKQYSRASKDFGPIT